ncbi:amino acid adenylation domain-containing protein [Flavobacterium sp. FlaQc-51]|uniref:amino acid adenylation domain-containing protein n=1 Tax=Flavobacterium sp. FlaQc-51 TaxID=3374184 RepID=UPI003757F540
MSLEKNSYYSLSPQQNFIYFNSLKCFDTTNRIVLEIKNSSLNNFIESISSIVKNEVVLKMDLTFLDANNSPCIKLNENAQFTIKQETDELTKIEQEYDLSSEKINLKVYIQQIDENVSEIVLESSAFYSDIWSLLLLADKTMNNIKGNTEEESPIDYLQFSEWKNQLLISDDAGESISYWSNKIKNSKKLKNNFEFNSESTSVSKVYDVVNPDLIAKLNSGSVNKELCLLSAWYLMLSRLSSDKDEPGTIGYIHNGRSFEQLFNNMGAFSFEVPFQIDYKDNNPSISEYLNSVENELNLINTHKEYLQIDKDYYAYSADVLSYQFEYIDHELFCKSDEIELKEVSVFDQPLKLRMQIHNSGDTIKTILFFNEKSFQQDEAAYLLQLWMGYCEQIIDNLKAGKINDIFYSKQVELSNKIVVDENSVLDLFEAQVKNNPDKYAVVDSLNSITYKELDKQSTLLAAYLSGKGVDKNSKIGILNDSDHHLMVAMLSVLKLGAAYIPIDPNDSRIRINHIVLDSGTKFIISKSKFNYLFADIKNCIPVFLDEIVIDDTLQNNNFQKRVPHDISYIIYTSGTTGKSKGVCIKDSSLVNYVKWLRDDLKISEKDSSVLLSSYAFDLGYTTIWGTILLGGTLHFVDRELIYQTDVIIDYILDNGITYIKTTPSYFNVLNNSYNLSKITDSNLSLVLLGGEKINARDVVSFSNTKPGVQFVNHYGPTETTIGCIAHKIDITKIDSYKERPVIGKPLTNNFAVILNSEGVEAEFGVTGEIYIGGYGLAYGYLNQPELTSTKFTEHAMYGRIYATGDLGIKFLNDEILFLGRNDNQVKIRGYRVELDEIKSVLESIQQFDHTIITTTKESSDVEIMAYVVSKDTIDEAVLKKQLEDRLPNYMIPSAIIQLDKIPMTNNNKIDYKKLPLKSVVQDYSDASCSPTEAKVISLWKEILQTEKVGLHDDFFALGGHSLKGIQFLNRVHKEFHIRLSLKEIYEFPTPKEFATLLKIENEIGFDEIELVQIQENYHVSNAQKRFWLTSQRKESRNLYNVPLRFKITGPLDTNILENAFLKIIERHESLRTVFKFKNGELKQYILSPEQLNFDIEVLKNIGDIDAVINEENIKHFDLENEIGIRAKLLELNNQEHIMLLTLHHIVSDGWSREIINREIPVFYNAILNNREHNLPALKIQYKDFVYWHEKNCEKQEPFWQNFFDNDIQPLDFPLDFARINKITYEGNSIHKVLKGEKLNKLRTNLELLNINVNDYFIGIYGLLISFYAKQDEFIIGTIVSGRNHVDIENLIGVFINYLPLKIKANSNSTLKEYLEELHDNILKGYDNQDYPFDLMVENFYKHSNLYRNPIFDTMIIFHNDENNASKVMLSDDVEIEGYNNDLDRDVSKLDFKVDITTKQDEIIIHGEYNKALFTSETMNLFMEQFENLLVDINDKHDFTLQDIGQNIIVNEPKIFANDDSVTEKSNLISEVENASKETTIKIISSFVIEPVKQSLHYFFDEFNIDATVEFGDYNQVFQELTSLNSIKDKSILICNRFEDYLNSSISVEENIESLQHLKNNFIEILKNTPISNVKIIGIFPCDNHLITDIEIKSLIDTLNNEMISELKSITNVYCIDFRNIEQSFPDIQIFDNYRYSLGFIPFTDEFFYGMSFQISRFFLALKNRIPSKVIALDCDNTLWKGVCGESETEDLVISDGMSKFQEFLVQKHNEGFLIVLVSKNNEEDVFRVFENHPDMILRKEHLVAWRINWKNKSDNIVELAADLSLNINSFIFIDDNPWECQQMMIAAPEVITLLLPEKEDNIINFLSRVTAFDKIDLSAEDFERNQMYKTNLVREELSKTVPLEDFLNGLDIKVSFNLLKESEIDRVFQLINRTNQFILNDQRKTLDKVLECYLAKNCYVIQVTDKFGRYGLTGVVIFNKENNVLNIETLSLSCRILGKKIEFAIIDCLKKLSAEFNLGEIYLNYKETERNKSFHEFIENNKELFKIDSFDSQDIIKVQENYLLPTDHITLFYNEDFVAEKEKNKFHFHHTGLAVNNIKESLEYFENLGYIFGEIVFDPIQNCYLTIGKHDSFNDIELVEGKEKSMVDQIIPDEKGIPYHLCFKVNSFDETLTYFNTNDFAFDVIKQPEPAILFDNKKVMFIYENSIGLIELLQDSDPETLSVKHTKPSISILTSDTHKAAGSLSKIGFSKKIKNDLIVNENDVCTIQLIKKTEENSGVKFDLNFNESDEVISEIEHDRSEVNSSWDWIDYTVNKENLLSDHVYSGLRLSDISNFRAINSPSYISDFDANNSDLQNTILSIYKDILKQEKVSLDDDFFQIGGNSLMATQILSRLYYHHSFEISLADFFENSSVRKLSFLIETDIPQDYLSDEIVI